MNKANATEFKNYTNEKAMRIEHIPFLGGRPKRVNIINNDDITNLKIILNTSKTFKEFLSRI